jgi:transcriptional repressor NrdR
MLVEDVIDVLEARFESEIPSRAIGEAVMQRLRNVDQVAYVRYASVYKEFRDASSFVHEVSTLTKTKPTRR